MKYLIALTIPLVVVILSAFSGTDNFRQYSMHARTGIVSDSTFNVDSVMSALRAQIKGRELEPAIDVFKNIQLFKSVPAGRFLNIMETGLSKSLGVNCTHCHNPSAWESEEKPQKQIARDMKIMSDKINAELLREIPNLQSTEPVINCITCHRGEITPALQLSIDK